MKNKHLIIIGAAFALICTIIVLLFGRSYTLKRSIPDEVTSTDQIKVSVENDAVEITDERLENGVLYLTLRSVHKGKCFVDIEYPQDAGSYNVVYVHSFGVITEQMYLGRSTGSRVIPIFITLYLALVLFHEYQFTGTTSGIICTAIKM